MKKKNLWRGLCVTMVLIFSLTMFGQSLAFTREGDINLFLGTMPPTIQATDDTTYIKSDYASMDEMRADLEAYLLQSQIEGQRAPAQREQRPAPGRRRQRHPLRLRRRHPGVPRRLRRASQ